jgi:hypothetical protein
MGRLQRQNAFTNRRQFEAIRTEPGNLRLRRTAWWGWEDSNFQPNDYQLLASEVPEVAGLPVCSRSDGSSLTLTFKDVVDRATALELGYNLNDCVELRWGAPEQSNEASTCKRHAPQAQRAKMTEYRT